MAAKRSMWSKAGKFVSAVVILAFFLPFFGVSCDGMDVITISGADMVGGCKPGGLITAAEEDGKMEGGKIEAKIDNVAVEPFAIGALVLLRGARFSDSKFDKAEFQFTKVSGATFERCSFNNTSFYRVDLSGVSFSNSSMNGAVFDHKSLDKTNFNRAQLERAKFTIDKMSKVDFTGANLKFADFSGVQLFNVDFSGADLTNARFDNAFITGCDFSGANLSTVFWDADNLKKNIFNQETRFPRSYTPNPAQMRAR